jgi:Spy/CpxP family protein refolding chaperone
MVIFGAGVLTGALVVEFTEGLNGSRHQQTSSGNRAFETGSPYGMRLEFLRRIQRELDLTAAQQEQIDKVLKQSQERTRNIMAPVAPQLRQELQRAKAEFRDILTPAQQASFDELLKKQQRYHRPGQRPESSLTNGLGTNSI